MAHQRFSTGRRKPLVTEQAPHIRDGVNLASIRNCVVLALLPSVLMGIYNTGYQANLTMAQLGMGEAPGWRGRILGAVQIGSSPSSALDSLCHGFLYFLPLFSLAVLLAWVWARLFAALRAEHIDGGFLLTALIFTLLLPPSAPLWQSAIGISFGVVFAKELFGGTGKNFLNPALTGLVFLHFAYPNVAEGNPIWRDIAGYGGTALFSEIQAIGSQPWDQLNLTWWDAFLGLVQGPIGATSPLAAGVGGLFLIHKRIISWRVTVGIFGGLIVTLLLFQLSTAEIEPVLGLPWYWHLSLGSLIFGAVFVATDPVCSPMTERGRWIYGFLIGFMVVLIRGKNPLHPDGVILAILLGNVLAPLIDSLVVWSHVRRRRRRICRQEFRTDQGVAEYVD